MGWQEEEDSGQTLRLSLDGRETRRWFAVWQRAESQRLAACGRGRAASGEARGCVA